MSGQFEYWTPAPGDAAYSEYIAQAQPATATLEVADAIPTSNVVWLQPQEQTTVAAVPSQTSVAIASSSRLPAPSQTVSTQALSTQTPSSSSIPSSATSSSPITTSALVATTSIAVSTSSIPSSSSASSTQSVFSSGISNKIALPTEDSDPSSFIAFFQKIGRSPIYITITVLVGVAVLILLVAVISFCVRRRSNRLRRDRALADTFKDWKDEEKHDWEADYPPVLLDEKGTMSPAVKERFDRRLSVPASVHEEPSWWTTMRPAPVEEDRYTALPPPVSGYNTFSPAAATLQIPAPTRTRSHRSNGLNRQPSAASIWSTSTGQTQTTDYNSSLASFNPSTGTVARRASLSSLSSFQSGRVSNFRRKLSMGTIRSHARKRSWELLEEEEEVKTRKAEALIRARMRRMDSRESGLSNGQTLVGEEVGKGY